MSRTTLSIEQQAEADRLLEAIRQAAEADLIELAELLATKDDRTIFGDTEFAIRDIVLRVGAKAVEAALAGRKKGGTMVPPAPARTAAKEPNSNVGRSNVS
jgi:hypothetical protein